MAESLLMSIWDTDDDEDEDNIGELNVELHEDDKSEVSESPKAPFTREIIGVDCLGPV